MQTMPQSPKICFFCAAYALFHKFAMSKKITKSSGLLTFHQFLLYVRNRPTHHSKARAMRCASL